MVVGKGWVFVGSRARQSEKAGEGNTVRALARMLVTVSGWIRWGLNWKLDFLKRVVVSLDSRMS